MQTRIDSIVRLTTRQSENAPSTSDGATASIGRGEDTGAHWPIKPAALGDLVMVGILVAARANHLRERKSSRNDEGRYWGGLTAESPQALTSINVLNAPLAGRGEENQAPAAMLAESSTSSGRQSIETKPGVCSTRLSQARIAGK